MTMMIPHEVRIHDWNENLVTTTTFQLMQWKHALKLELRTAHLAGGPMTFKGGKRISTHVRKVLSAPRNFSTRNLYNYIAGALDSVTEQLEAIAAQQENADG